MGSSEDAPDFDPDHWEMKPLPYQTSADGGRAWEKRVDALYREGGINLAVQHGKAQETKGESRVGSEHEFALKCNC